MKKILFALLTVLSVFLVIGCVQVQSETTTTSITTTTQLAELPNEEVEVTFWHIYGEGKSALLDQMIVEFEAMYPNVTITSTSQSDYDTLRTNINTGIGVGQVPTMAIGYPDHFAGYITTGAVESLDQYIYSTTQYEVTDSTSSIFGEIVETGLELSDFIQSYLDENDQYQGGYFYSVPYSKSTETMAVNRSVLAAHITEIRAAGITISDNGFLSHETPLTYDQLVILKNIIVDPAGTNATTMKCEYLLNYDSSGNLYINMSRQWHAGYTNSDGDILIDNATTRNMLQFLYENFTSNTIVLPVAWSQSYGSTNFIYGDVCMSVGSTAGVNYNIPNSTYTPSSLKLGIFNVDFLQVPQYVTTDDSQFTVEIDGTDVTMTGSRSAVQQGPNIGIFHSATAAQKLYAWLFIKYLISTDNTAKWAMNTGYLPVRLSAYSSEEQLQLSSTFSLTYSEFLGIAQDFWAADGEVTWELTDQRWNYLYSSMVANIAFNQADYYQYDPAFAAGSHSAGSATARVEAGYCLQNIYTNVGVTNYSPDTALNFMINQLTW
ncbi:MAG: extracellular solute-binding protein [Firmicutes bacterium]|nr:extracellular solute-binding protein [Bacillota bacterium]